MVRNQFTPPCGFDLSTTTIDTQRELSEISYWGYRLVCHSEDACFVHETYYDAREGVLGIAREPARPCGETVEEVRLELRLMEDGLAEPMLNLSDFEGETPAGASGDGAGTPFN